MATPEKIAEFRLHPNAGGEEASDWDLAIMSAVRDELNILRAQHGLADRTLQQVATTIRNRVRDVDLL